jgi:hypothetical protein
VRAASSYQSRSGAGARAEIADPKMPHIGKLHLNPPYAEAVEHYSLPSEPLAKNRRTLIVINFAY